MARRAFLVLLGAAAAAAAVAAVLGRARKRGAPETNGGRERTEELRRELEVGQARRAQCLPAREGSALLRQAAVAAGVAEAGVRGWCICERQWVEFRHAEVRLPSPPPVLHALTILHLSHLRLGTISFNGRALER